MLKLIIVLIFLSNAKILKILKKTKFFSKKISILSNFYSQQVYHCLNYLLNHYVFEKAILWSDIIITIIICILYLIAGLTSKTIIYKETKTIKNIYYGKITNYHLDDILSMTIYPNNKFVGNIKLHLKNGKDKGISISDISSFTDEIKNLSNEIIIEYK